MYEIAQEKLHLEQQITEVITEGKCTTFYLVIVKTLTKCILLTENENADKKSILKLLKMTIGQDVHNKSLSSMKNANKGTDAIENDKKM